MKGHLGHTLGACGAIESWWTIEMMNRGWFAPTLNLKTPDPRCGELDYVTGNGRDIQTEHRSEEHTSELQSLMRISYAVFCLKKTKKHKTYTNTATIRMTHIII